MFITGRKLSQVSIKITHESPSSFVMPNCGFLWQYLPIPWPKKTQIPNFGQYCAKYAWTPCQIFTKFVQYMHTAGLHHPRVLASAVAWCLCSCFSAFVTPFGQFQWCYMPFGLHNAPVTFLRLVTKLLLKFETFCTAYLEDILIFSDSCEAHLKHRRLVFPQIQEAGLTLEALEVSCRLIHVIS